MSEIHAADADPAALLAALASEDPAIAELVALTADVEPTLARVGAATGLPLAADPSRPDQGAVASGRRAAVVVCDDATTDLAEVASAAAALPAGSIVLLAAPRDGSSVGAAAALIAFPERGWTPEGRDHAAGEGAWAVFRLERRDFAIRLAVAADLPVLERLERDCWAPGLQMPTRTLARRIERFPLGQLVLEHAGAVVGAVYSQRIAEPRFEGVTATDVHRLHRPDGPVLQLLALNIAPTAQDRAFGDILLEFALERAATLPGVEAIVGVTRCKDARKHPDLSHADYIALTNAAGRRLDPVLRMHELHGAEIIGPVEGYRPKDAVNGGAGVLVRYDPKRRQRRAIEPQTITSPSADVLAMDAPPRDALAPVREAIAAVLGRGGPDAVPPTAPLFELGLDSADLLDLNERLSAVFGRMIEPAFFFERNTAARIAAALDRDGATRAPIETGAAAAVDADDVRPEDVAIVGLACRLPGGVGSPEAFWQLLAEGRNAVGARPTDRWAWPAGFDPATHPGIDRGGFLDDVARFDAAFFRISPKEARVMDPQQRLLLEAAWTAFEDAGWRPSDLAGSDTGVFVGASGSDYHLRLAEAETEIEGHYALGASMAVLANRISYFFDFDGPSLQIDTACSSSLVALNEAVAALRAGTCGRALVAGVNVLCHAAASIGYWRAGMLSKDGRCKTFDAAADGYVRGEGVVALVLKPLAAALADGDRIEAVIKGTATNHGGQAAGLTVPNPARQADLVRKALAAAGIGPETISYIEAHGTGTALGDPIEVRGLKQAFGVSDGAGPDGAAAPVCLIGSVKTNIGHLEAAAGLAGLIKTVLALRARTIPASLNFSTLNPHLSFEGSRFAVATAASPWVAVPGAPRRAGVSSFGSGGANAHAVLEEAPRAAACSPDRGPFVIPLSARDEVGLRARAADLAAWLDRAAGPEIGDIAYTLQLGREAFDARAAAVVEEVAGLRRALAGIAAGEKRVTVPAGTTRQDIDKEAADALRDRRLDDLARLWGAGATVDWAPLWGGRRPRRLALPTHRFGGDRHWAFDAPAMTAEPAVGPASDLAARVRAHVAAVLAMPADALDETAPLRSYGLDSIGGIKLQERLADDLGVTLSGLDILESADLAALVAEIAGRLGLEALAPTRSPALPGAAPDRPLSEGQKGLWAFQAAHPDNAAYNLPFLLAFEHPLDDARLEAAIRAATARHPVLGERIVEQVDGPRRVGGAVAMVMRETAHDLDEAALSARLEALATVPFRLADEAPLRVHRIDRDGATLLLVVVHHIAFDGASVAPFFETLLGAYAGASIAGPEGSDFDAFVAAEAETIAGEAADRARRHFASRLAGAPPALDLPFDPPHEAGRHDADAAVVQRIEAEETVRIAGFCRTAGVTPASLFLGAFGAVLGRWAGTDDVVVGVTASVRRRREFADLVGYCVNMVPVRLAFAEENTWAETLRAAQRALTGDLDHAAYPFARLVRDLRPERSDLRTPVFQVAFNHTPHVGEALRTVEARHAGVRFLPDLHQRSEYELELEISEAAGAYELRLKFDSGLFRAATAERIVGHLRALIAEGIARPAEPLGALDMLTEAERRVILGPWAGVDNVEAGTTVDRLVLAQAARTPDALAVVQGDTRLTYTDVVVAARQVTQSLLAAGIQPGDRVGIALRRTPMLPVALLGVFMAGAAYVPLEPDLPEPRLRFMAEDAGLRMILTEPALQDRIAAVAPAGIAILEAESGATRPVGGEADPALATGDGRATPDGLAYVIYTSGSTGRPKGVMIRQSAYVSALLALARTPGLAAGDRLLAVTTFGFDIAGFELLGPLVVGATCSLCPADVVQDADRLRATIEAERPTLIQATPSLWDMLFESGWRPHAGLRLLCGGEPLPDGLRRRFEASAGEAWNMYGPTEATIWATAERIAADAPRGVGRPLANSRIYVLDRALRPVPIGVIGELCIGGQAIAEGYLGRPDLTAARFLANPFEPGGRLYRTGDRARWLPDGSVDLLGRADDQVKIRGYRIELGDVETHLAAHPAVREAIAVVETVEGHARLAAHVLLRRDARVAETDLRDHMKARVPHYMVPSRFVVRTAFPLTPNGKVDRAALAAAAVVQAEAIIAPRGWQDDGLERRIAAIWREVLRRPEIGLDDGFFEVGGDSILAVIVARRIAAAADRPFGVTDLFRHPSIAAIAAHLGAVGAAVPAAGTPSGTTAPETAPVTAREVGAPAAGRVAPSPQADAIAIVGLSGAFPGADTIAAFWDNLLAGVDAVRRPSVDDLRAAGAPEAVVRDPRFVSAEATIAGKALFDAAFFRVAPRDAERMHPQMRLLLAHAWNAVEDAGYAARDIPDTAVYMTASNTAYGETANAEPSEPDGARVLAGFGPYQAWLLAQPGTIPTLVSHRLGFTGPSCFVHSNCSSSLVALDLACRALRDGTVGQALVGAASMLTDWSSGYVHQDGLNFSSDGRVKAFDAAADGMVGGEGVAVVMLKRLADAVRDGDTIRAVIRGIAVSNDGADKAGFYAPGAKGQVAAIRGALAAARIDRATVRYVEAHGTGTALGDPIEVAALAEAFGGATLQGCGLGSVKSNIGHLDAAAGLAGLIKAALALQHGIVPPTLHFEAPNPHVPLEGSPFFVVAEPMRLPADADVHVAVSSFGIGGTDAHVILGRAPAREPATHSADEPHLVLLSARDGDALKRRARDLRAALGAIAETDFSDLAHTLAVGRQPMDARLAVIARDSAELADRLDRWLAGEAAVDGVEAGQADAAGLASAFAADPDFAETVRRWIGGRRLAPLAAIWVRGHDVDWRALWRDHAARRLPLPGYPFAREAFWLRSSARVAASGEAHGAANAGRLHPLVHENTSTLAGQRFAATFSGREPFLADHRFRGVPVLPGVAHLEMARAAAALSLDAGAAGLAIEGATWLRPLTVEHMCKVVIEIEADSDDTIAWAIRPAEGETEPPFSRGRVALVSADAGVPPLDLQALRGACGGRIDAAAIYRRFTDLGFDYGPAQRALTGLAVGQAQDGAAFVLAEIMMPAGQGDPAFGLHPSILDAMLQARIGFDRVLTGVGAALPASMPFAIETVQAFGPMPERGVVLARAASGGDDTGAAALDIDLADETGRVLVTIRGFASRSVATTEEGVVLARPVWRAVPAKPVAPTPERRLVVLCGERERATAVAAQLARAAPEIGRVLLGDAAGHAGRAFREAAAELLIELKALAAEPGDAPLLVQVVAFGDGPEAIFEGLHALLASARMEHPRLVGQVIRIVDPLPADAVVAMLADEVSAGAEGPVRHHAGCREIPNWEEMQLAAEAPVPWRDGGVYLVTGGHGGLGLVFAEDIARRATGATVVLLGRSGPRAADKARFAAIEATGTRLVHRTADVADEAAMRALVAEITAAFGPFTGVLHAAGLLADGLMASKPARTLEVVMRPKTDGADALDTATAGEPLELFVLFASTSGAFGNVGQTDYAAANAFLDAFAERRNHLVAQGLRQGRTIALDWPLWADGGMRIGAGTARALGALGRTPLPTVAGLAAFDRAITSGEGRVLVLHGEPARLRETLFGATVSEAVAVPETAPVVALSESRSVELERRSHPLPVAVERTAVPLVAAAGAVDTDRRAVIEALKRLVAPVVGLPPARIEADAEFERYGIDSVMAVELVGALEKVFGALPKTLLFEFRSLGALADHVMARRADRLPALLGATPAATGPAVAVPPLGRGDDGRPSGAPASVPAVSAAASGTGRVPLARSTRRVPRAAPASSRPDIAIIGLAGRYPKARDVDAFWQNLRDGVDAISEIPGDRWDHSRYFDPDKSRRDKTYSKWGGFIDGVDECDPLFFGIAPREMEAIDPQERLFLQCAYEAIEDAGYTRRTLARKPGESAEVGVYVGVMYAEYQLYGAQAQSRGVPLTLTGSPASIANRVSYFFDFTGPSIAVDTMCSSSLTAIHLACRDLAEGCDYAVAGGVNVSVHPNKYLFLGQRGFVSSLGRCQSFGEGGDGYVPGEGVGAVLLKPLDRALADGDRIYGVIRGTALNHGGKTNGYTVPNPQAQARVIEKALRASGVDARDLSYVEAHGTGTALGDPIEIAGLARAFEAFTLDRGFCAIGSAKSNIGHCESAAGIAGLTKVLLQMKHGELAPSLHAETLNPHIDFDATPFVVQRERAPWRRSIGPDGREKPRIAGISSFGAGGANAHVVIEEFVPAQTARRDVATGPQVLVLSARTEDQLRRRAVDLVAALGGDDLDGVDLADIAFTLQLGREALDHRLALVADSVAAFRRQLEDWLDGGQASGQLWAGTARREADGVLALVDEDDLAGIVERWLERGDLARLAEAWTRGIAIDWSRLHDGPRRRVRLPTYPFERRRLWPVEAHDGLAAPTVPRLHPLLHENRSDLFRQSFRSRFAGDEPFLADHVVHGEKLLPGVAQLEMARVAAVIGGRLDGAVTLRNVVWLRPAVAGDRGLDLAVALEVLDDGAIGWTIAASADDAAPNDGAPRPFSQGEAEPAAARAARLDLDDLTGAGWHDIAVDDLYDRLTGLGLVYGPRMRGLRRLRVRGAGDDRIVVAEIEAPDGATEAAVFDAALQATLALDPDLGDGAPPLPYALDEVTLHGPLPKRAIAVVRLAAGSGPAVRKVDLDIAAEDGTIFAALRGLAGRAATELRGTDDAAVAGHANRSEIPAAGTGTILLTPVWEPATPAGERPWPAANEAVAVLGDGPIAEAFARALPDAKRLILPAGADAAEVARRIGDLGALDHLVWAPGDPGGDGRPAPGLVTGQEDGVLRGFRIAKALIALGYATRPFGWTTTTVAAAPTRGDEPIDPTHASIHGLLGSLAKEFSPAWRLRVLDLPRAGSDASATALVAAALRATQDPGGDVLALRDGGWLRRALVPSRFAAPTAPVYRDDGVYVVLGGAGGIGAVWTEHVVRRHGARVAWIGRRAEDDGIRAAIARIGKVGPAPIYIAADATDPAAMERVRDTVRDRLGPVTGIVHSALVLQDASLARMDEATFRAALAAKVDASVHLAAAFAREPLETAIFFSSMMSFAKSAGQANYAAGCTFVDAFAHAFGHATGIPAKIINWGFWGSVGVVATDIHRERMRRYGFGSVEPEEGMAALETLLAAPVGQVAFLKTERALTRDVDGVTDDTLIALPNQAPPVLAGLELFGRTRHG